jgi:hypothetical protein
MVAQVVDAPDDAVPQPPGLIEHGQVELFPRGPRLLLGEFLQAAPPGPVVAVDDGGRVGVELDGLVEQPRLATARTRASG